MQFAASLLTVSLLFVMAVPAISMAAQPTVNLGTTSSFAVLAGSTITNTGPTTISGSAPGGGDVGLYPGTSITGFPPGIVSGGTVHLTDPAAIQAKDDLVTAYNDAAGRTPVTTIPTELGGQTLTPGVYASNSGTFQITGTLTLDGQGESDPVFIFQTASTLITASDSNINPINNARYCRTFWRVGSSATLGTNSHFVGHIFALTSITANTGATVQGQLLARNGAVTLDTNTITNGICASVAPTPTPTPATLHVIKHVINANGGTSVAGDFIVYVKIGGTDVVGSPATGAETPGTTYAVAAGTYTVSENASAIYTASYSGDSDASGNITLAPGDNKTVTITNTYIPGTIALPATLHVIKLVINNDGRTSVAGDFTVHVKASGIDVAGSPAAGAGSPGTTYTLDAGTYAVSEDASATYAVSYSGDGDSSGNITLAPGDNKTVTITNTYFPIVQPLATLHVIKHVINANGGTSAAGDFIVLVKLGGTDVAGSPAAGAETPGAAYTLAAGTYAVSENASATYAASYGGDSDASGTITLAPGDNKTVTITNSEIAIPVVSLNITKTVRNMSGTVVRTGSVLRWTIVVTNFGNVPATNVVASDTVPAHSTYVKRSITGLGHDDSHAPALLWNVGTVGVGESVTLTFESSVNSNVANGTIISNRAWMQATQSPRKSATAQSGKVSETTTKVVRTSGDEDVTLGLMGLLAALALGFAWHGRSNRGPAGKRGTHITVALLLSAALALGGMEVGAAVGLPLPSPGEAITSAAQAVMAITNSRTVAATVATARIVGRVRIPSIGVNVCLVEGSTMSALNTGLWRQPPSAKPGTAGACVIAGHRISSQFSRLSRIKVGAPVWVAVGRRTYKYRVASVSTGGTTLSFRTGATEKLILYTCLPRWQGNKRTVVVCYRTSP